MILSLDISLSLQDSFPRCHLILLEISSLQKLVAYAALDVPKSSIVTVALTWFQSLYILFTVYNHILGRGEVIITELGKLYREAI